MKGEHHCSEAFTGEQNCSELNIYNDKDYFIYADTDSIHTQIHPDITKLLDIDSKKLGYWKHESSPIKARFLRAKTYIEVIEKENKETHKMEEKIDVKCAGMSDKVKEHITFESFHFGFTDEGHKLAKKTVKGGAVLLPTSFKIERPRPRKKKVV